MVLQQDSALLQGRINLRVRQPRQPCFTRANNIQIFLSCRLLNGSGTQSFPVLHERFFFFFHSTGTLRMFLLGMWGGVQGGQFCASSGAKGNKSERSPQQCTYIYVYVPSPHSLPLMLAARSGNVDTRLWERSPRNPTILGEGAKEGG